MYFKLKGHVVKTHKDVSGVALVIDATDTKDSKKVFFLNQKRRNLYVQYGKKI